VKSEGRVREKERERERRYQNIEGSECGVIQTVQIPLKKEKQREREDEKRCHAMKRKGEKMKKRNHQNTRLTHS
jgi:hypothetical protein